MNPDDLRTLRHDLRGSLNTIRLSVEVLRLPADGEDPSRFLDAICREIAKIDRRLEALTPAALLRSAA